MCGALQPVTGAFVSYVARMVDFRAAARWCKLGEFVCVAPTVPHILLPTFFITAASHAQRAVEYLHSLQHQTAMEADAPEERKAA